MVLIINGVLVVTWYVSFDDSGSCGVSSNSGRLVEMVEFLVGWVLAATLSKLLSSSGSL